MQTKEMMKASAGSGNWFINVAPLGSNPDWQIQRAPEAVNLNATATLFGYPQAAFMARQYR